MEPRGQMSIKEPLTQLTLVVPLRGRLVEKILGEIVYVLCMVLISTMFGRIFGPKNN